MSYSDDLPNRKRSPASVIVQIIFVFPPFLVRALFMIGDVMGEVVIDL